MNRSMNRRMVLVAALVFVTSACALAPDDALVDIAPAGPAPRVSADARAPVDTPVPAGSVADATVVPDEVLDAARLDPMVGVALSGPVVLSGEAGEPGSRWMLLSADVAGDGLLVLMRENGGWKVADAGGVGIGCGVAPLEVLSDLGVPCG